MGETDNTDIAPCPHGFDCSAVGCLGPSVDPSIRINIPGFDILKCNKPADEAKRIGSIPAAEVLKDPRKFIKGN